MESKRWRRIKDGTEFDNFFPAPSGDDTTIKKTANVADTLKLIQRTVPQTLWHTKEIAKRLNGRNLDETCSNIWHFVYGHVQYKRDKDGVEQVRSPRRTWWERNSGVDCDCYTEFISSILLNLGIPHKARITKYPKRPPEVPRWQHIYPVVPRDGNPDRELTDRDSYIVMDCVKDNYDDEQPFLEAKDFDMKLDYLDGLNGSEYDEDYEDDEFEYIYENVDVQGLAELYDEDELGFLKKLRKGIKKVAKKVGSAVKKVAKKVGDAVGEGVRFINRYANPATILLRNGFLLAMKQDMFNVAEKLRFAYLSDDQAKATGIDLNELKKLRKVKDRAETVYWQAGGQKSNLKKAIIGGKGNKDKKVQLQGLAGPDDNVYADIDEYNIIHMDMETLEGLGEVATGTALAAATGAVAAVSAALKQIKGLFTKGSDSQQSDSGDGGNLITKIADGVSTVTNTVQTVKSAANEVKALIPQSREQTQPNVYSSPASATSVARTATASPTQFPMEPVVDNKLPATTQPTVPAPADKEKTFMEKTTAFVKEHKGKLLMAGLALGAGVIAVKALSGSGKRNVSGLEGIPKRRRKKSKKRSGKRTRQKVYPVKL